MNPRVLILLVALLAFGGTAIAKEKPAPLFVPSADQTLPPPPADQAQIIFLEPINSIQGLFPVGIFETDGDKRTLLATTGSHTKAALLVAPGHHMFMAYHFASKKSYFLDANVEAGKRYYVLVRFVYGNGFQLRPIRPAGPSDYSAANPEFASWNSITQFVDKTSESDALFEKMAEKADKSQAAGWANWQAKSQPERDELTLTPQDAISP